MTARKQDFTLVRGDDLDLEIALTDEAGAPYVPDQATWSLALSPGGPPILQKTIGDGIAIVEGEETVTAIVSIASDDTGGLTAFGRLYWHQLETIAAGKVSTVAEGLMTLTGDIRGALDPVPEAGVVPARLPSYTVAGLPSASSAGAGAMAYVSNESGGAVPAFSDGTSWRRVTDRAVVS